tara:strand:+ start:47 stop:316 length:270 start_codon:yes stop_codon:yes gene_type:complete
MNDFFRTRAGLQFFQVTVPALVEQLKRIADALEEQNKQSKPQEKSKQDDTDNQVTPVVCLGNNPYICRICETGIDECECVYVNGERQRT